jgi:hypothetical protein
MMVNEELKRMWKEVVVAAFKILSRNLPVGTQESYEKPKPGSPKCPGQDSNRVSFQTNQNVAS